MNSLCRFVVARLAWLLILASAMAAAQSQDSDDLLRRADRLKTREPAQFASTLQQLRERPDLSSDQREYLRFLEAWKKVYDGEDVAASALLQALVRDARQSSVQIRARATLVEVLLFEEHYGEAFTNLGPMLDLASHVRDGDARQHGFLVAAELYTRVREFELALQYAQLVIDENWASQGSCKGGQKRMHALYDSGKLDILESELRARIDACIKAGEGVYANEIRSYGARLLVQRKRFDEAIDLLRDHYEAHGKSAYSRQVVWFDASLAEAYRGKGDVARAGAYLRHAVRIKLHGEFDDESVVTVDWLLYELAKERGDYRSALAYHERYDAANRGFLNGIRARQLAFERVSRENIEKELALVRLSKQNQVLRLQNQLSETAAETSRLQLGLLGVSALVFLWWGYRAKREQLRFKKLSETDYLTQVKSRHYLMEQGSRLLEYSKRGEQELSLVLFDVDHFKKVNDTFDHLVGDSVMKRMTAKCGTLLRKVDILSRIGGEEFAILLPGCSAEEARRHSETLRMALATISVLESGDGRTISASFGVTSTRISGYDINLLLGHADRALLQAKRAGRNRVVVYEGSLRAGCVMPEGNTPGLGFAPPPAVRRPMGIGARPPERL
jgi:diguanylate cyclase (GGDEF)-like protein